MYPILINVVMPAPLAPRFCTEVFGLNYSCHDHVNSFFCHSAVVESRTYHHIQSRFKCLRSTHQVD